ncbi:MBL fold metallo-hydrolase [Modicisalibacter radicis]|uniref:MBL fold metallo-hydrolase n=1 Tax=Halomonas sp. EAR18 TaxID=2518972 RepID=UPI00109CB032|nr:MBL fold metallo-hydrolase [Halomonas sp. EAR18]
MIRVGFRWLERGSCRHPERATISGGSLCPVDFPALVGVIEHPERGLFLFDTGYDSAFIEATTPFPERLYRWATPVDIGAGQQWKTWLDEHGIEEDSIAGTIVSHFHGDHVAGIGHLARRPVHCSRAGLDGLRRTGRFSGVRRGLLPALVPRGVDANARFFEEAPVRRLPGGFAPFTAGHDILGDGSLLAVELPGHCVGHWGLALRTTRDHQVLLAGDAVWLGKSIREGRPPPFVTTALLGNTRRYRATLQALIAADRGNRELTILPSHCADSASRFRESHAD